MFGIDDGANWQAQAVLAYLKAHEIEESYRSETGSYRATPTFARWYNCREQGYIVSLRCYNSGVTAKQLNIVFFENRNSDDICAICFYQTSINPITIDTIDKSVPFMKNTSKIDKSVHYGNIVEMGNWIHQQLSNFWKEFHNESN